MPLVAVSVVMAALVLHLLLPAQAFQEAVVAVAQAKQVQVALQPLVVVTVQVGLQPVITELRTQVEVVAAFMMRRVALEALVWSSSKSQTHILQHSLVVLILEITHLITITDFQ